jgi:hypothetical protein
LDGRDYGSLFTIKLDKQIPTHLHL